jgi:hypothetical protein
MIAFLYKINYFTKGKEKHEMEEKCWKEMDGWGKTWKVIEKVGSVALRLVVMGLSGLSANKGRSGRGNAQGGSVWARGQGGKKIGSWSSLRHK